MPRKNSIKRYYENGFYHIYNRGTDKRDIFSDQDDYHTLLHLLKTALLPKPKEGSTLQMASVKPDRFPRENFHSKIDLLAYCLMPNHFHFLLRQSEPTAMTRFMRSIWTSYAMYFNKKHQRSGSLFQGIFKATDIEEENYLLWVSRYIHRNPSDFRSYPYSSYSDYLGKRNSDWLKTSTLLDYFSNSNLRKATNYQKFVDDDIDEPGDLTFLTLEDTEI